MIIPQESLKLQEHNEINIKTVLNCILDIYKLNVFINLTFKGNKEFALTNISSK